MVDNKLKEDGDFYFGQKLKHSDGMLEVAVYYQYAGEKHVYIAVGEDNIDLMRDWAFEWLDIFGNGGVDDDGSDNETDTDQPDTTH